MSLLCTLAYVLLVLVLLCARSAAAAEWLQPFSADYRLSFGAIDVGEAHLSLRLDGDGSYVYESVSRATGTVALFLDDVIADLQRLLRQLQPQKTHPAALRTQETQQRLH